MSIHPPHIPHAEIKNKQPQSRRFFETDKGTVLLVHSITEKKSVNPGTNPENGVNNGKNYGIRYKITIERINCKDESERYSLVNLGIQGVRRRILIRSVKGTQVRFRRPKKGLEHLALDEKNHKIRGTYNEGGKQPGPKETRYRRVWDKKTGHIISERIWFIEFSGTICELEVIAFIGIPPNGPKLSHEWAPPPPDPGSEEGDDEYSDEQPPEEPDEPEEDDGE